MTKKRKNRKNRKKRVARPSTGGVRQNAFQPGSSTLAIFELTGTEDARLDDEDWNALAYLVASHSRPHDCALHMLSLTLREARVFFTAPDADMERGHLGAVGTDFEGYLRARYGADTWRLRLRPPMRPRQAPAVIKLMAETWVRAELADGWVLPEQVGFPFDSSRFSPPT